MGAALWRRPGREDPLPAFLRYLGSKQELDDGCAPVPSGDELRNWVSASLCEIRWMEGGLAVALVALRPQFPHGF